jgi:spore maturation protein CgeB
MRIFVAVRHSNDPQYFYGGLWRGNFYPAIRQLGHEIVESQVDLLPASRFMQIAHNFTREELAARADITQRIIDEVRAAHRERPIDLFLSYFYNSHFDPAGFDEIRKLGIPSVNFYCNSVYQFEGVAEIAARADFSWHPEKTARARYLKGGARPVCVQMAADPEVYHPMPEIRRELKACFIGQRYADRDRWMATLIQKRIPVAIYGPGWGIDTKSEIQFLKGPSEYLGRVQRQPGSTASYLEALQQMISKHGFLPGFSRAIKQLLYRRQTRELSHLFLPYAKGAIRFQKISEILATNELCLNFSNVWADGRPGSKLIPHVRLRDFEAPMCRTCYLTGYTDEIREFYEVGKEIDTYRTAEELVDKARYHLAHPEAAEKLREAGYCRARRDHTWKKRFQELFRKTGLCT